MNQIKVDKEKVPVLGDNIKEGVVTKVVIGEEAGPEEEGEGGAEAKDMVGRGDTAE